MKLKSEILKTNKLENNFWAGIIEKPDVIPIIID